MCRCPKKFSSSFNDTRQENKKGFFKNHFFKLSFSVSWCSSESINFSRMADGNSLADTSSSKASDVHEETTVQINIKTLESSVFTFRVDRKMSVLSLKETIAGAVGVPFGQQRLIFKGKVLKDDHFLSDYHIEDGDTLHLVARQPIQSQPTNSTSSEDARSSGNEPVGSLPRPRIGHSVVLGLNVSDQGENTSVDISRIIGSVLNTLGVGNVVNSWTPGNPSSTLTQNINAQGSQTVSAGAQTVFGNSQTGIPSVPMPSPGTFLRQMVIPDSLTTLSAFITRMEQVLPLHSGYQSSAPSNDRRPAQLDTSSSLQYPSPDTLITLLERAHELLSGPAAAALSHLSGRLERERGSVELAIRGQIQAEAMHVGVTMQQLGSLFLELGRTISTLRMGSSPAESMVYAGPAVYISASGPNPIMVQPVPTQNSTLFAIPFPPIINVAVPEGAGISASTAGIFGSRANTGEAPREHLSAQSSVVNSSHDHSSQSAGNRPQEDEENVIPPQVVPHSDIAGQEPETTNCNQYQEIGGASDLESCHPTSSQMEKTQDKSAGSSESTIVTSSKSLGSSQSEQSGHVPLGLGLGGLQPKRRIKQSHSEGNSTVAQQESTSNEHQQLITKGQEVLESLVSQSLKIRSDKREKLTSPASSSCAASVPGSRKSQVGQGEPPNLGGMLSGMLQQMMPVVSQAFGIGSAHMSTSNPGESGNQHSENGNNMQVDLRLAVEGMEQQDLRGDVFCRILQAAGRLYEGSHTEILDAIGNDEELRKEFKEMMRRHLNLRLQRKSRQNNKA